VWDGYSAVPQGGSTGHYDLRTRAWQLDDDEEKRRYRSLMRAGVTEPEAFMRVTDPLYDAHWRQAERADVEPLKPSQWMECRAFRDQTNGDLDAIVREYMRRRARVREDEDPATHSEELARDERAAREAEDPAYQPKYPWLDALTDDELAEDGVAPAQVSRDRRPAKLDGYPRTNGRPDRPSQSREAMAERKRRQRERERQERLAEFEAFHFGGRR
jgi:hypothetical protein